MPQYFQVLRCYKCFAFQVHQVKKSNKFECKLCGEKQSIKRHYGTGTGKECRQHVQRLNIIRGDIDDSKVCATGDEDSDEIESVEINKLINVKKESKWSEYLDKPATDTLESTNEEEEVVLEVAPKRRKFSNNKRNKSRASYKREVIDDLTPEECPEIPPKKMFPVCDPNNVLSSPHVEEDIKSTVNKQMRIKFIPPTCSKQSKWAQYTDDTNHSTEDDANPDEDMENVHINAILGTNRNFSNENSFDSTNKINSDSKLNWHKTNTIKKLNQPNNPISVNSKNKTEKLFSLCNDNDLDNILDI